MSVDGEVQKMMGLPSRMPSVEEIAEINARHLIETPLKPADLLFVFGTRAKVTQRIDEAYRLWQRGYFRSAIVSGGVTPGSHLSECEIIKSGMVSRGIPSALILEEHRATNTGQNVIFSLPIIDAAFGLANIKSVICLGSICTSRRYLMTLHRHWPEVEKMLIAINYFNTPTDRWHTDPNFRTRVLAEWGKIEPYKAKSYIVDWPS
jgi:uncharacterized SAM-binding protein YcdF (DUF218 family)